MSSCAFCVEVDDETGHPVRCPGEAKYEVAKWGVAWQIEVCGSHAEQALGDGCDVICLEDLSPVRLGDDGIETIHT